MCIYQRNCEPWLKRPRRGQGTQKRTGSEDAELGWADGTRDLMEKLLPRKHSLETRLNILARMPGASESSQVKCFLKLRQSCELGQADDLTRKASAASCAVHTACSESTCGGPEVLQGSAWAHATPLWCTKASSLTHTYDLIEEGSQWSADERRQETGPTCQTDWHSFSWAVSGIWKARDDTSSGWGWSSVLENQWRSVGAGSPIPRFCGCRAHRIHVSSSCSITVCY